MPAWLRIHRRTNALPEAHDERAARRPQRPSNIGRPKSSSAQILRRGLARLSISDDIKRDLLSLVEAAHPGAFDRADVHEDILAAVIRLDESKAFLAVKKLHGSVCHIAHSFRYVRSVAARSAAGFIRDLGNAAETASSPAVWPAPIAVSWTSPRCEVSGPSHQTKNQDGRLSDFRLNGELFGTGSSVATPLIRHPQPAACSCRRRPVRLARAVIGVWRACTGCSTLGSRTISRATAQVTERKT
jgi:hypothetical protein